MQEYIKIKDLEIPYIIRNYKYSTHVKFYYRSNILNISKPKRLSIKKLNDIIKKNEEYIYKEYIKITASNSNCVKEWISGEKIFYKGKEHTISIRVYNLKRLKIIVDEENKLFEIMLPEEINSLETNLRKEKIDKFIKKYFKEETYKLLEDRLRVWSEFTKIEYKDFKVADAISRYGSCIPKLKKLHFSSRLVMLPIEQIDGVIVHELCHMIHPNHSDKFYNLVKSYIPDYEERTKWLKNNNKILAI